MIAQLRIVGISRMNKGRVCVSGYDSGNVCVRIDSYPGIQEADLRLSDGNVVQPFSLIEVDLGEKYRIQHPHTEDRPADLSTLKFSRLLDDVERRSLLEAIAVDNVRAGFGSEIQREPSSGCFVHSGEGERSLCIIRPLSIDYVTDDIRENNKRKFRMKFHDQLTTEYFLTVNDLTWYYFLRAQSNHHPNTTQTLLALKDTLNTAEVFLRIGLAREYPIGSGRCNLQITGIYTFPDYLNGCSWNDYMMQCQPQKAVDEIPFEDIPFEDIPF